MNRPRLLLCVSLLLLAGLIVSFCLTGSRPRASLSPEQGGPSTAQAVAEPVKSPQARSIVQDPREEATHPSEPALISAARVSFAELPSWSAPSNSLWRFERDGSPEVAFDVSGDHAVELESGVWHLRCVGGGYTPSESRWRLLPGSSTVIWISKPWTLSLHVTDTRGAPLSGAQVDWTSFDAGTLRAFQMGHRVAPVSELSPLTTNEL
jgi:hypothetical protein